MTGDGPERPPRTYESPSIPELHCVVAGAEPFSRKRATHGPLFAEPGTTEGPVQHWSSLLGLRWSLHIHQMIPPPLDGADLMITLQPVEAV